MCGIAGFNWLDRQRVELMCDRLRHRGPDDEGCFVHDLVSLGHRRLSIIDLSAGGRQPMSFTHGDRTVVLTYNGEIYNFRELRTRLEGEGFRFSTQTDTEVVAAAYLAWGGDGVREFNGMWALALFDIQRQTLLLSRDRFGQKPLYYFHGGGRFVFASEVKAILVHDVPRRANRRLLSDYLYRGITGHTSDTFFEGIHSLPPGSNATYDHAARKLLIAPYYRVRPQSRTATDDDLGQALDRSVGRRLVADVPLSVSLSGGLDSTAVAASAVENGVRHMLAFTTRTGGLEGDESEMVDTFLARYPQFEVAHNALDSEAFIQSFRRIVYHMDEPCLADSAYVRWEIARTAHDNGLKVILNGEGADEILGGYWPSSATFLADLARGARLARFVREVAALRRDPDGIGILAATLALLFVPSRLGSMLERRRFRQIKQRFGIRLEMGDETDFATVKGSATRDVLIDFLTRRILPNLLGCNDKMSMAHSVEARSPFLDFEVVETALSLDPRSLVDRGLRKSPLRRSMKQRLPAEILGSRKKIQFTSPLMRRFGAEPLRSRVKAVFADPRSADFIEPRSYRLQYDRLVEGRETDRRVLLCGWFLEEWMRVFDVG